MQTFSTILSRALFSPLYQSHCQNLFDNFIPSQKDDQVLWHQTKTGEFSTKAYYETQRIRGSSDVVLQAIWCRWLPPKVSALCWRIYHQSLPTDEKIKSRGISLASACQCCLQPQEESLLHIIFQGQQAMGLWRTLANIFDIAMPTSLSQLWKFWFLPVRKKTFLQCVSQAAAAFGLWELWTFRNKRRMEQVSIDCFKMLQHHLGEYVHLIKRPADDSLRCHTICSLLHVQPGRGEVSGRWIMWKPKAWGNTLSCALVEKGQNLICGYIFRDFNGSFIQAGAFDTLEDDLIPNLVIISDHMKELQREIHLIQSSHQDMEYLAKNNIPWQNIKPWRQIRKDHPHASFAYIPTAANSCALALVFASVLDTFPAYTYMPLSARRAFIGDWKQMPSFQDNEDYG